MKTPKNSFDRPPAQLSDSFSSQLTQQKTLDLVLCSLSHSSFSPAGSFIEIPSLAGHLGAVLVESLFTTLWVCTVIHLTFSDALLQVWWLCLASARKESEILAISPATRATKHFCSYSYRKMYIMY